MNTAILHVDVNNFYVACHILFHPHLQDRPVLVLSANDGNIIAASARAKLLGWKRGTSLYDVLPWVEPFGLVLFSASFPLYADLSRRVVETIARFSPEIEFYSVDELFLRVPWTSVETIGELARTIRRTVLRWTGLVVSIGIGGTKTISKLATRFAKKQADGIFDLASDPFRRNKLYQSIPVQEVWGIGSKSAQKLHQVGIFSVAQMIALPDHQLRFLLSIRGVRLAWELRGYPLFSIEHVPPAPQSISRMRTFAEALTNVRELEEALALFVTRTAEKLRRSDLAASALAVFISTGTFHQQTAGVERSRVISLPAPTNSTLLLQQAVREGLEQIFSPGQAYRRAGVHLLGLVSAAPQQQSFLISPERLATEQRLARVVDILNRRFGNDTVYWGSIDPRRPWQRQSYPDWEFTTNWREIPVVRA